MIMSVYWVLNKKVNSLAAKIALISLAVALFYMPLRALIMTSGMPLLGFIGMAFTFTLEIIFVLPAFILAIHLFRFNLRSEKVVS